MRLRAFRNPERLRLGEPVAPSLEFISLGGAREQTGWTLFAKWWKAPTMNAQWQNEQHKHKASVRKGNSRSGPWWTVVDRGGIEVGLDPGIEAQPCWACTTRGFGPLERRDSAI
jgi:hypothetical protein